MNDMQVNTFQARMNTVPHYDEAIASLQQRRDLVLQMMQSVLKEGVHFGKIPGCGDKPSLFLPGAEQLSSSFGFSPRYKKDIKREGMHLIAEITCELCLPDGTLVAEGISICSTYESKYRYRAAEGESTGAAVPKQYWDLKKEDPKAAQAVIGGPGFSAKKIDGIWTICKATGEKVENPDLADQWNTIIKMGAKRSFVHAVRTATGTADVFTQDIEDFRDSYGTVVDAEVVIPEPERHAPQPVVPSVPGGWTEEAQGQFFELLDTHIHEAYRQGGHPELFQAESDKWHAAKKADPAEKVLAGLTARVKSLQEAAAKALAKKAAPANPTPPDTSTTIPTPGPEPIVEAEIAEGPQDGTPEYTEAAKAALNAACARFFHAYEIQGIAEPKKYVIEMRDKVTNEIRFPDGASQDLKKMMLAEAMQARANKLKIP
jgi:hypothetical protein